MNNMLIAEHLKKIKESPTLAVAEKAADMKSSGLHVISLSTGEPDFDTPEHIKEAAVTAIRAGKTKYTAVDGTAELKSAISHKFSKENNISYSNNEIIVCTGAKQVIYNAFVATLDPGDEVIIPAPFWVSYPDMVLLAQGVPKVVQCGIENNFKLLPSQLEKAITSRTKWLLLNSPSNPVGSAYTESELRDLMDVVSKHENMNVLSDDIYEHVVFNNFKFSTPAEVVPHLKDRILTVNGVSKSYAMTGWRIGYGAGNKKLIKAMSMIQSQSTSNPCSISQAAAVAALLGPQDCVKQGAALFEERLTLVNKLLKDFPALSYVIPDGAFYLFISCTFAIGKKSSSGRKIANDIDFASGLLEEGLVAVVPGSAFGMPSYFRISFATSNENLRVACSRILDYCASII